LNKIFIENSFKSGLQIIGGVLLVLLENSKSLGFNEGEFGNFHTYSEKDIEF
jgi:hypothetical protein